MIDPHSWLFRETCLPSTYPPNLGRNSAPERVAEVEPMTHIAWLNIFCFKVVSHKTFFFGGGGGGGGWN